MFLIICHTKNHISISHVKTLDYCPLFFSNGLKMFFYLKVVVGFSVIFALAIGIIFIRRAYKRKVTNADKSRELEDTSVYFGVSVFSYAELQDATNHFDSSRELGDGGFGTVYYGSYMYI